MRLKKNAKIPFVYLFYFSLLSSYFDYFLSIFISLFLVRFHETHLLI